MATKKKIKDYIISFFSIDKKNIFLAILIILLVLGIVLILYSFYNPKFDSLLFLSGISTYVIAIFTATYAYLSSKQVDVMISQISETRKSRELQDQPMPWIEDIEVVIKHPVFYYSPPNKEYSVHSRCLFRFSIKNVGTTPAVSIDVQGRIGLPTSDGFTYLGPSTKKIDVLEEKQKYPTESEKIELFFNDKKEVKVLEYLLERTIDKTPFLQYRTVFRNIIGGKFFISQAYLLLVRDDEKKKILKNWLSEISSFKVNFIDEMTQLERLRATNLDKWNEIYNTVCERFEKSLVGDEIEVDTFLVPKSIAVHPINQYQYDEILKESNYGLPSILLCDNCLKYEFDCDISKKK